ncbi:MAG TPA: HD domain-containing protein [Acidimicrobiales bacterium]
MVELTPRFTSALDYARAAHLGVVRKGSAVPYLSHVLVVAGLVLEHGGGEDEAIAALLHDVAEDSGGEARLDDIGRRFGDRVAGIVRDCSDSLVADPRRKEGWWPRKLRHLDHLARMGERSLLVSAADKTHNCESTVADYRRHGEDLWARFNSDAGRAGQLWYHRRVSEVLSARLDGEPSRLAERLQRAVTTLVALVEANVGAARMAADAEVAEAHERAGPGRDA